MRTSLLLLLIFTAVVSTANTAFADSIYSTEDLEAVMKPGGENAGPSAGTLAAAALETAGYKAQEMVLKDLKKLLSSGAALVFTICLMVGLTAVAVIGKYEGVLWLFIGPVLYAFVLTTTSGSGAQWQYGNDPKMKTEINKLFSTDVTQPAQVSQVFHWYNSLVSNVYRNLIAVLSNKEQKKLMMEMMSRQRITDELLRDEVKDGRLRGLIGHTVNQCSSFINASRTVALAQRDASIKSTPAYAQAQLMLKDVSSTDASKVPVIAKKKQFGENAPFLPYLKELLQTEAPAAYERRTKTLKSGEDPVPAYLTCLNSVLSGDHKGNPDILKDGASCNDLFCYIWIGVEVEANRTLTDKQKEMNLDKDPEVWKEVQQDMMAKMTTPEKVDMASDADNATIPADGINYNRKQYERFRTDTSAIPVIVGGHLIRKAMSGDNRSQVMSQYANHAGLIFKSPTVDNNMSPEQQQSLIMAMRQEEMAAAKQWELYTFAMILPYLQGVLLYTLSLTFPFFAIFLIVPGRARTLFSWMTMWAWAKSWDVGWVLVAIVDDILWNLLPNSSAIDPLNDPKNAPIQMFDMAFQGDPSYSLATYYMLMSMMIVGVPVVTAQILMGGKNALSSLIQTGATNFATKMGGYGRDWMRHEQASKIDPLKEAAARKHNLQAMQAGHQSAMKEIQEAKQANTGLEKSAQHQQTMSKAYGMGGVAALGVGALMLAKGKGGALGYALAGAGLGGINAADKTWKDSVKTRRHLSKNRTELNRLDLSEYYALSGYNKEYRQWDNIRAGVTDRGEFFNFPDSPANAMRQGIDFRYSQEANSAQVDTKTDSIGAAQGTKGAAIMGLGPK